MTKFSKAEMEDLILAGYDPFNPASFPENIDPAIRSKLQDGDAKDEEKKYSPLDHDHDGKPGGHIYNRKATAPMGANRGKKK